MKNLLLASLLLVGCSALTPSQQTAVSAIEGTALSAGIGYLSGGAAGAALGAAPSLVNDVQLAALALRGNETPAGQAQVSPIVADLTAAIQIASASPAVAKALGPTASQIVKAVATGKLTPNIALETAAVGLDKAAAAGAAK